MPFDQPSEDAKRKGKEKADTRAARRTMAYHETGRSPTPSPPGSDSVISRVMAGMSSAGEHSDPVVPDQDDDDEVKRQGQHLIGDISRIVGGQFDMAERTQEELSVTQQCLTSVEHSIQTQAVLLASVQQEQRAAAQQQKALFDVLFARMGISSGAVPMLHLVGTPDVRTQPVLTTGVSGDNGPSISGPSGSAVPIVTSVFDHGEASFHECENNNAPPITPSNERFGKAYGKLPAVELLGAIRTLKDTMTSPENGLDDGFVDNQQSSKALFVAHAAEAKLGIVPQISLRDTEDSTSVTTRYTSRQDPALMLSIPPTVVAERREAFHALFLVGKDTPRMPLDSPTFGTGQPTDVDDSVPLLRGLRHKMFAVGLSHNTHGARIVLASMGTSHGNRFCQRLQRWVFDGKPTAWSDICDLTFETFPPSMTTWAARDKLRDLFWNGSGNILTHVTEFEDLRMYARLGERSEETEHIFMSSITSVLRMMLFTHMTSNKPKAEPGQSPPTRWHIQELYDYVCDSRERYELLTSKPRRSDCYEGHGDNTGSSRQWGKQRDNSFNRCDNNQSYNRQTSQSNGFYPRMHTTHDQRQDQSDDSGHGKEQHRTVSYHDGNRESDQHRGNHRQDSYQSRGQAGRDYSQRQAHEKSTTVVHQVNVDIDDSANEETNAVESDSEGELGPNVFTINVDNDLSALESDYDPELDSYDDNVDCFQITVVSDGSSMVTERFNPVIMSSVARPTTSFVDHMSNSVQGGNRLGFFGILSKVISATESSDRVTPTPHKSKPQSTDPVIAHEILENGTTELEEKEMFTAPEMSVYARTKTSIEADSIMKLMSQSPRLARV